MSATVNKVYKRFTENRRYYLNKSVKYNQLKKDMRLKPRAWSRSKQSRLGLAEQKHGKPCARQTKQQQKSRDQQAGVWATELIEGAIVMFLPQLPLQSNEPRFYIRGILSPLS